MYKKSLLIAAAFISGAIAFIACSDSAAGEKEKTATADSAALVARGQYLVTIAGCDDCHSPKRMGPQGPELIPELRFSGFPQNSQLPKVNVEEVKKGFVLFTPDLSAAIGPWGISYAANITSDASGIGNWREENFINALRHGKFKGLENSRPLLPPMPWINYSHMTDEDIKAVFAFLKTTTPVDNVVPAPKPLSEL